MDKQKPDTADQQESQARPERKPLQGALRKHGRAQSTKGRGGKADDNGIRFEAKLAKRLKRRKGEKAGRKANRKRK